MRIRTIVTTVALLAVASIATADTPPTYAAYRDAMPPTLDGVLSGDPGWANIPAATGYHTLGDGYTTAKQTTAYATWDHANLYIGVVAEEPDIARVSNTLTDGSDCWLEDSVEIFIEPTGRQAMQYIITGGGARASGAGSPGLAGWAARATKSDAGYTLEIRISFATLGRVPKAGDAWRIDFCRNIWTTDSGGDKYTCWAPLVTRFLEPENYAILRFEGGALTEAGCRQAEHALNGAYRAEMMAQLAGLAKAAEEYVPLLTQAAAKPSTRAQAEPLKAAWDRAVALRRDAEGASLTQVRASLRDAESLRQRSYQLKYEMLIEALFENK
jgi:hypothetical protein